jgi:hypothetical protein
MNQLNKSIADIPLPDRLKNRPISAKGFPVPWFVSLKNKETGDWDFRALDVNRATVAHRGQKCWICGQRLGTYKVFSIGPMCVINRLSSEPPAHRECAWYAAHACPFMANPRMRRNSVGMVDKDEWTTPGIMLERNPGVICLWTTKDYKVEQPDPNKGILFRIGALYEIEWWCESRMATHDEIMASVESGLPFLREAAQQDGPGGVRALDKMIARATPLFAPTLVSL